MRWDITPSSRKVPQSGTIGIEDGSVGIDRACKTPRAERRAVGKRSHLWQMPGRDRCGPVIQLMEPSFALGRRQLGCEREIPIKDMH